MRIETITESQPARLKLTEEQAKSLVRLGQRLASQKAWWGEEESPPDRSVISCRRSDSGWWRVRVHEAVGVIATKELQISVRSKIPEPHLLFLFETTERWPRIDTERAGIAPDDTLWRLLAQWFVGSVEELLRADLIRDYRLVKDTLGVVRGRIDPLATARAFYKGSLSIPCEFDEFDIDNPLNRVILHAVRTVVASPLLPSKLRRRAVRLALRFQGVTAMRSQDLAADLDPRTAYYRDPFTLAKQIVSGSGRSLTAGAEVGWTFLIRTPEMVEEGVRQLLVEGLADTWPVKKGRIPLVPSNVTLNPDLIFSDHAAVADVKYKITQRDWSRPDLYQIIAFSVGAGTTNSAVVSFSRRDEDVLPRLMVGEISVTHLPWIARDDLDPREAASRFVERVRAWLGEVAPIRRVA